MRINTPDLSVYERINFMNIEKLAPYAMTLAILASLTHSLPHAILIAPVGFLEARSSLQKPQVVRETFRIAIQNERAGTYTLIAPPIINIMICPRVTVRLGERTKFKRFTWTRC